MFFKKRMRLIDMAYWASEAVYDDCMGMLTYIDEKISELTNGNYKIYADFEGAVIPLTMLSVFNDLELVKKHFKETQAIKIRDAYISMCSKKLYIQDKDCYYLLAVFWEALQNTPAINEFNNPIRKLAEYFYDIFEIPLAKLEIAGKTIETKSEVVLTLLGGLLVPIITDEKSRWEKVCKEYKIVYD